MCITSACVGHHCQWDGLRAMWMRLLDPPRYILVCLPLRGECMDAYPGRLSESKPVKGEGKRAATAKYVKYSGEDPGYYFLPDNLRRSLLSKPCRSRARCLRCPGKKLRKMRLTLPLLDTFSVWQFLLLILAIIRVTSAGHVHVDVSCFVPARSNYREYSTFCVDGPPTSATGAACKH